MDTANNLNHLPSGFEVIRDEFKKDKIAFVCLLTLIAIIVTVTIASLTIDQELMNHVSLRKYPPPSAQMWLGGDSGGRPILQLLLIGTKNSLLIATGVTVISMFIGILLGMIMGFYAGWIDYTMMRVIDFIIVLPSTLIIIVLITIVNEYNVISLILILLIFSWIGTTRLIRSRAMVECRKDYISAARTVGTPIWEILFKELLPNLSSLVLVDFTLTFAGNIGIETGLSFLGFGLPPQTPSLGTLINYANRPEVLERFWWVWVPAAILILILVLCINYVGGVFRRAADINQRLSN